MTTDPRIPLTLLHSPAETAAWIAGGAAAALLTDGAAPPSGAVATARFDPRPLHRLGCACCAGRPDVAIALDRLFQDRARGRVAWFDRVGVLAGTPVGAAQVASVLEADAVTLARFRPA